MPVVFEQFARQKALDLVHQNMAFTGDFADWVVREISTGDAKIYVAALAPVKLRRKIGPFKRKTRLRFQFLPNGHARLRFRDREKFEDHDKPCRLDALGQEAIVLIVEPLSANQPCASLTVNAGVTGDIIQATNLGRGETVKQIFIWHFKVIDPADMVGWYDPLQLMRTGVEVFFSTLFGRHSDYRLMEALTPVAENIPNPDKPYYDFTRSWKANKPGRDEFDPQAELRREIWLDYVGDVGDGWDSTYAVAHCLAKPRLTLEKPTNSPGETCSTKRGEILIFGGDEVYPIANRENYVQRLLGPYETALDETESPHPHAFAIPGNHDWYDSLVSFTRLFCQNRWFAGWQTDQSRSYFALKLPGQWWVLGTDVQLDSDIDVPQVKFFKKVAESIQPGDRVIIFTAEPHWIYAKLYGKNDSNFNENNLAFFEKKIIPNNARIVAFIAGDEHHYRRYQAKDYTQKITAGGGGAFLHPTHGEEAPELEGGFRLQASYPEPTESNRLGRRNFLFLKSNPWFGVLTGALYLLTAWSVMADVGQYGIKQVWPAIKLSLKTAMINPFAVFWILAVFVGFVLFTDTHSKFYRWTAGPVHGLTHLIFTFLIGWAAARIASVYFHLHFQRPFQLLFSLVFILFFGWIIGSTIMGVYLYISLNWCRRHSNEAFSALAIKDWKNFLRFKIEKNGQLTIFPIGIQKVPGKWKRRADGAKGPGYEPDDKEASGPMLIERPILFTPVNDQKGGVTLTFSEEGCLSEAS